MAINLEISASLPILAFLGAGGSSRMPTSLSSSLLSSSLLLLESSSELDPEESLSELESEPSDLSEFVALNLASFFN